jgi:hypothetical protein
MVGCSMFISWTTDGKPTVSITLFLKFSGSEPARFPSSAQTARNDSRMCGSGSLSLLVGPCPGSAGESPTRHGSSWARCHLSLGGEEVRRRSRGERGGSIRRASRGCPWATRAQTVSGHGRPSELVQVQVLAYHLRRVSEDMRALPARLYTLY